MANEQNLIPNSERTPEELKRMTTNGGKRSGEVRREKKRFKEMFETILNEEFQGDKNKPKNERRTNKDLFVMRMIKQAMDGDLNSQKYIIEMIGEAPSKKVEVTGVNGAPILQNVEVSKEVIKKALKDFEKECNGE